MKILCPKCNGQGCVSKPPFVPGDINEWSSYATSFTCNLCNGSMVIEDNSEFQKELAEKDRVIAQLQADLDRLDKKRTEGPY